MTNEMIKRIADSVRASEVYREMLETSDRSIRHICHDDGSIGVVHMNNDNSLSTNANYFINSWWQ